MSDQLEKLFHEPNRLNLMAELCGADGALSFRELKESCELTDGNLSRHLATLEQAGAVNISKTFSDNKPLTTAKPTQKGRRQFLAYLDSLESVLEKAQSKVSERGSAKGKRGQLKPA